jgi:aldehyde dehydrogenase (NAD+)
MGADRSGVGAGKRGYHVPFGEAEDSGIGPREQGLAAWDFYTQSGTLLISP